jgi:DNA-binding SARP family transcriptional activator
VQGADDRGAAALGEPGVAVLSGPPGSYVAERLAGAISGWHRWRNCVWLRVGNVSPSSLAGTLGVACAHRWEDPANPATPEGDPHRELRRAPPGAVVVLELPRRTTAGIVRWIAAARPIAQRRELSLIAVIEHRCPAISWSGLGDALRAWEVGPPRSDDTPPSLLGRYRDRLVELAGPRAALVRDVVDAARVWSVEPVVRALDDAEGARDLLDDLTESLVGSCSGEQRAALRICLLTGYWHPQLAPRPIEGSELRPWLVPLEGEWGWLRPLWSGSLRRVLGEHPEQGDNPRRTPPAPSPVASGRRAVVLQARLLGPFEVRVDGRVVSRWNGRLGPAVFRYLLARPGHASSRDELLAEFWPETAPHFARNRLQVVISGLRRALGEITAAPVIEYDDGCYRLAPALRVDTDVARFEAALEAARAAERDGDTTRAVGAYREVLDLYRGDFAADSGDGWTLLPRESLRMAYIDALDRLGRIHLDADQLDDAIAVGQRMVELDLCREDAHRMIMVCYARQGRFHQALRQYDFCARVLRTQLDVDPQPCTTRLISSIREGVRVPAPSE